MLLFGFFKQRIAVSSFSHRFQQLEQDLEITASDLFHSINIKYRSSKWGMILQMNSPERLQGTLPEIKADKHIKVIMFCYLVRLVDNTGVQIDCDRRGKWIGRGRKPREN